MRIIGYHYNAASHCPACTLADQARGRQVFSPTLAFLNEYDEHGIHEDAIDREGNPVSPGYDLDAEGGEVCDDCGEALE